MSLKWCGLWVWVGWFYSLSLWALPYHPYPTAFWESSGWIRIFIPHSFEAVARQCCLKVSLQAENQSWFLTYQWESSQPLALKLDVRALPEPMRKTLVNQPLWVKLYQNNQVIYGTPVVLTGVLDDEFAYDGPLGLVRESDRWILRVWAPSAQKIRFLIYQERRGQFYRYQSLDPKFEAQTGVWWAEIPSDWLGFYYQIEVTVFHPSLGQVITALTTDPYSQSLSANGLYSFIGFVDQIGPTLQPLPYRPKAPVIYEAHIRALTVYDPGVPSHLRGTFQAIAFPGSQARKHLLALAQSGVTHIQFLPVQDFATVPEGMIRPVYPTLPNNRFSPLEFVDQWLQKYRHLDGFNWGYDPVHFMVPDGSYATRGDGATRVLEFKRLIHWLHSQGLGVVLDVVFNHTYAHQIHPHSRLDLLVPGYYYRWSPLWGVTNSSCCSDTESRRYMFKRLMSDALVFWTKNYGIDGFRFDLMNLHDLDSVKEAVQQVKKINPFSLVYGEAWYYGSLWERHPDLAFTQDKAFGLGIGVFNDKIRDAIRGGTPDYSQWTDQGLVTGLVDDFNQSFDNRDTPLDDFSRRIRWRHYADVVRVSLAGNLRGYVFEDFQGNRILAKDLYFRGQPLGWAQTSLENVNYVSVHDGFTLWDAICAKLPFETPGRQPKTTSVDEKVRRHQLALSFVLLSQGVAFVEAGSEILFSKNGDVDSYDSGDYVNGIRWLGLEHPWGGGLPPSWKNGHYWPFWRPRLLDLHNFKPNLAHQEETLRVFHFLTQLRRRLPHFHYEKLEEIQKFVYFVPQKQLPDGVIVLNIKNDKHPDLWVFWNVFRFPQMVSLKGIAQRGQFLSPVNVGILSQAQRENDTWLLPELSLVIWQAEK